MTPTEMLSPEETTSKARSDMNAQTLYDKCNGGCRQPLVDVATGQFPICFVTWTPFSRWAAARSQPDRAVEGIYARTSRSTRHGDGAVQPNPSRLPSVEGLSFELFRNMVRDERGCVWVQSLLRISRAEFGIHESVPIYSGGLGVLSGDHIKSASGLGIPLIAVGLFYDQGYFKAGS